MLKRKKLNYTYKSFIIKKSTNINLSLSFYSPKLNKRILILHELSQLALICKGASPITTRCTLMYRGKG